MLLCPVIMKLITQATAANGPMAGPNSSTAMMLADIGVFAAPASSATIPIAENMDISRPKVVANAFPEVAPIKNMGVTTPPLPPKLRVIAVNRILPRL